MNPDISNINQYVYKIKSYNLSQIFEKKYLLIDLEATGYDYRNEDIIEISILPFINLKQTYNKPKFWFIEPSKPIPKFIQRLTNITQADFKQAVLLDAVLKILYDSYLDYIWVAQCGFEFDFPFLKRMYRKYFAVDFPRHTLDTKIMFQYLYPKVKNTISTNFLLKYYSINTSLKRHRAQNDVNILSDIFLKIVSDYKKHKQNTIKISKPLIVKKFVLH